MRHFFQSSCNHTCPGLLVLMSAVMARTPRMCRRSWRKRQKSWDHLPSLARLPMCARSPSFCILHWCNSDCTSDAGYAEACLLFFSFWRWLLLLLLFLDQPKFWHALISYGSHVQARRSSKTKTGRGGATASWSRSRVPRCAIQAAANRWVMPPLGPATGISVWNPACQGLDHPHV